ncbi:hypothetical protein ACFL6S_03400 [Candidatus Poribacteria bacterium]
MKNDTIRSVATPLNFTVQHEHATGFTSLTYGENLSGTTTTSNQLLISEWSGDWVTELDANFTAIIDSTVSVNESTAVTQAVNLTNSNVNISFTDLTVNLTPFLHSGFSNTSSAFLTQDLTSDSMTSSLVNVSGIIAKENSTSSLCPGIWSDYGFYCAYTNVTETPNLRYYFYRSFLDINDSVINQTNIVYNIPISRFTDWSNRNSETVTLANITASASYGNINISSNSSHVTATIIPGSPSLDQGDYQIDIEWNINRTSSSPGDSPSSGGSSGSASITLAAECGNSICEYGESNFTCPADCWQNVTFRTSPESHWRDYISESELKTHTLTIMNPNAFDITALVSIDQNDDDESWLWSSIINGEERVTFLNVNVSAGSEDVPGRKEIMIETKAPTVLNQSKYWANVIVSVGTSRKAIPLRYEKSVGWFNWLDGYAWEFDAAQEKKMGAPGLAWKWVVLALIVIGVVAWFWRAMKGGKDKNRR